eukprot:4204749-Amphidinium_carterae.4
MSKALCLELSVPQCSQLPFGGTVNERQSHCEHMIIAVRHSLLSATNILKCAPNAGTVNDVDKTRSPDPC